MVLPLLRQLAFIVATLFSCHVGAYQGAATDGIQGAIESSKVEGVLSQYFATILTYDPERATRMGLHGSDELLTQRTRARVSSELEALSKLRMLLAEINKNALSAEQRRDVELLDSMIGLDVYNLENTDSLSHRPQYYLEPLVSVYELLSKDFDDYGVRATNALSRLRMYPSILEQAKTNIADPPRIWVEQTIKQITESIKGISEFVMLFRLYTRYDPVLKDQVDTSLEAVTASLTSYRDFLQTKVLPAAEGDPRTGQEIYGYYLKYWHGVEMSPSAAHSYAKRSYKAALKSLERKARELDPELPKDQGWRDVMAKYPKEHPPADEVFKKLQSEIDRAYQHLYEQEMTEYPRSQLFIKEIPAFIAPMLPYVYYSGPFALDQSRTGELLVALPSEELPEAVREKLLASGFNYPQIELLIAYMAVPGMHLRESVYGRVPSRIRKISSQPMVTNGWACYAEALAGEAGYYSSTWVGFQRAYVRMLRAARAYVETGFHAKRITYDQAVAFFEGALSYPKAQAQSEVLRLSLAPTESFSYVLGFDRIVEMRRKYQNAEGDRFDPKKFHAAFLQEGKVTLDMLAEALERKRKGGK